MNKLLIINLVFLILSCNHSEQTRYKPSLKELFKYQDTRYDKNEYRHYWKGVDYKTTFEGTLADTIPIFIRLNPFSDSGSTIIYKNAGIRLQLDYTFDRYGNLEMYDYFHSNYIGHWKGAICKQPNQEVVMKGICSTRKSENEHFARFELKMTGGSINSYLKPISSSIEGVYLYKSMYDNQYYSRRYYDIHVRRSIYVLYIYKNATKKNHFTISVVPSGEDSPSYSFPSGFKVKNIRFINNKFSFNFDNIDFWDVNLDYMDIKSGVFEILDRKAKMYINGKEWYTFQKISDDLSPYLK